MPVTDADLDLAQANVDAVAADRALVALRTRGALAAVDTSVDAAAERARKHMVDFQRGFAMAGLSMRTPVAQPT